MRCSFFARPGNQERQQALHDVDLLIAIQAAGEASPEDPPIDLVLRLIAELRARRVDAPHLLDAVFVADIAEAGAQAEAAEIQPANFVRRAAFAVFDLFEEDVGQAARDIDRPGVASQSQCGFETRRKFFGSDASGLKRCAHQFAGRVHRFLAYDCRWRREALCRWQLISEAGIADASGSR